MLENIIVFSVLSIIFLYQFALTIGYKKFNWKSKLYGPFWTQMATFLGIVFFITGYALSLTDIFFEPVKLVSNHEVFIKTTGWIAIVLSQIFYLAAQNQLGQYWNPEISVSKQHKLITEGVYSYIRHPMYTSFILLSIGLYIIDESIASLCFVMWALLLTSRVFAEEKLLLAKFGQKYQQYQKKTGLLIPR
jgi:protein-S-isoprenylcysteine O-methyltransferase Ste14